MDPQAVTLIVSVLGFSVAALGLLLAWYRRPAPVGETWTPPSWLRRIAPTRGRLAFLLVAVIVALTLGGIVTSAFVREPLAATVPTATAPLTEPQYRSRLSQVCRAALDEADRIVESKPQESVFGVNAVVEGRIVDGLRELVPPSTLLGAHDALLAAWERRVVLLESINPRLRRGDDPTVPDDMRLAENLAIKTTELSNAVGVPECSFF